MDALLNQLKQAGVSVRVEDGRLLAGPKGAVTDEVRALLKKHKVDLIDALHGAEPFGYGDPELKEFQRLLNQLGDLEGWSGDEKLEIGDEFARMAPARFPAALEALRTACREAVKPWPEPPSKRANLRLCDITGRRTAKDIRRELAIVRGGRVDHQEPKANRSTRKVAA